MNTAKSPNAPTPRLDLVDALRGFAMMGICLLHFVEHFDMGGRPSFPPAWLAPFDKWTWEASFFTFGGKSYALFALLFGVSFFIQADKAGSRGQNHTPRFVWRLLLLAVIGYLHGLLFVGDFLGTIAVLGLAMLVFRYLSDRWLLVVAAVLLLIPTNLTEVVRAIADPVGHPLGNYAPGRFYKEVGPAMLNGTLADVARVNLWLGQKAKWVWTIDNGRYLQMLGLFALGLVLGRSRLFEQTERLTVVARLVLISALILLPGMYLLKANMGTLGLEKNTLKMATALVGMYVNSVQMLGGAALLVLLFRIQLGRRLLGLLVPYGRMSLSCYVTQALVGAPLFYNFGLGLYRHLGNFYSLLAGIAFFAVHLWLAHLWLRHFTQGPLEWLWRCATEQDFSRPLRKRQEQQVRQNCSTNRQFCRL